jgi:hypothetical protein
MSNTIIKASTPAVRAARVLCSQDAPPSIVNNYAEIIDLETGLPELIEACKDVLDVLEMTNAKDEVTRGAIVGSINVLRDVMAKYTGDIRGV